MHDQIYDVGNPVYKYRLSRLSNFNCEHYLFVYIVKQQQKFRGSKKKFRGFSKFNIIEILIIQIISLGSSDVPHKIWFRSVQTFWRLLDTNKQTSKVFIDMNDSTYISL